MAKIFKYRITDVGVPFTVNITGFHEIVHVGVDGHGQPSIWAMISPHKDPERWTFMAVPTGSEFAMDEWVPVGSFVIGEFVWHLLRQIDSPDAVS